MQFYYTLLLKEHLSQILPMPFCDYHVIKHRWMWKQFSKAVIMRLGTGGGSQNTASFTTLVPLEKLHEMQLLRKQERNTFDYVM